MTLMRRDAFQALFDAVSQSEHLVDTPSSLLMPVCSIATLFLFKLIFKNTVLRADSNVVPRHLSQLRRSPF